MPVLAPAYVFVPKNFHEIAGLRSAKIDKVAPDTELMKQARCAWAVGIPAAPNAFAIALITDDQLVQSSEIEL